MGFLKKFGSILLKVTQVVAGIAPIAEAAVPQQAGKIQVVSQDLAQIATIVGEVEAIGQALSLTGPQKLTAAAPLVGQVVLQSSVLAGKQIADPAKFQAAVAGIASNMADLLNSLKADVESQDKAA